MADYKLGIIGCGNMGQAILKGILDGEFSSPDQIIVYDVSDSIKKHIVNNYRLAFGKSNNEVVKKSKYILIAVKPQNLNTVLEEIKMVFDREKNVIISIVAGIPTYYIEKKLNTDAPIIRIMPNTPALVKQGMSAVSKGKFASEDDFAFAINLIKSIGDYVVVEEKYQNVATALSGSGPAYFFVFCKHLIEAGIRNGLSEDISKKLVIGTIVGASEMIKKSEIGIEKLIEMVKSPGGTTEKALHKFNEEKIDKIVLEAVNSAIRRAYELQEFLEK